MSVFYILMFPPSYKACRRCKEANRCCLGARVKFERFRSGSKQLLPPGRGETALGRRRGRLLGSRQWMLLRIWERRSRRSSWRIQEPREKGWGKRAGKQGRQVESEGGEVEGAVARRKEGEAPLGAIALGSAYTVLEMWTERKKLEVDLEDR